MLPSMDRMFGPVLPGKFDFTLLFELVMLGMVPAGIAILVTPIYLAGLAFKTKPVRAGYLLWLKLAAAISLVAVQLASIVLWTRADKFRSNITLAASILSLTASLCVIAILYIAHTSSLQTSAFLSIFLSLTMLFDITTARSYFLRHSLDALAALQVAVAFLKLVLAALEEVPKLHLRRSDAIQPGISETVGFWNRSLLLWINPLLKLGFRKNLAINELPYIGDRYDPEKNFDRFTPNWNNVDKKSKLPLPLACFRTIHWQFLVPVLPRLCFIGFSASRPFLMQRVIDTVGSGQGSGEVANGLIGAFVLIFGGLMISRSIFDRLELQAITSTRGILAAAVYDKAQRLSIDELGKSAAITLLTADIAGVETALVYLHATWSSLLELGLGVYVLYTFVSYACFLLFIPASLGAAASFLVTRKMARARTKWNVKIEGRIAATSNILAQLKSIKAMGLTGALCQFLQQKRLDEIDTSMQERNARVMIYGIYGFGAAMTPVAVLAGARFWTRASNPMTVSETFSAYAAIFIAALPLNTLLSFLPYYGSGYACMIRIQQFLILGEIKDQRGCPEMDRINDETSEKAPAPKRRSRYAVEMKNVTVMSELSKPILKNVSVSIPRGTLSMVHGTVGSGKSAFLKTLLGELGIASGTIDVATKRMAYASEGPWIQNVTLQDNIIGPYPFAEDLYEEIVYACGLDRDMAELPDGDQTMAGSNGCNLSGGQKQRLGLARSLFARTSIIILDDVFSALDLNTASLIFERVCGPDGLLRRWNSTVIMTTNNLELLKSADIVFEISNQGLVRQHKKNSRAARVIHATSKSRATSSQPEERSARVQVGATPPAVDTSKEESALTEAEKLRRHGDIKLYWYLLRSASIWAFALWLAMTAIAAVMERMPQIFMRIWLNTDAGNDWYFAGFLALSVVEIMLTCTHGAYFLKQIVPKSSAELHWRLLCSIMEATLPFLSHVDAGSLLNRLSQDVELISQQMPLMMMTTVSMGFNVLADIGIVSSGSQYAPPIIVFLLAVLYMIQHYYLRTSRQLRHLSLETMSPLVTQFTETISGIAHIRNFGWQEHFRKQIFTILSYAQTPFYYLLCIQQWLNLALDFTTLVVGVILTSIALVFPNSSSDTAVGLALLNLISFSATASLFLQSWVRLETSLGGLARIQVFCKETPVEQDATDAPELPDSWPLTGNIDFNCVTASYRGADGNFRDAFSNTTFSIQHGQKVGISGRTGSGKSSMLLALLHLLEISGSISIDGRDIKSVPRHDLRSRITTMTQDGVEFIGTVRMNIFPFTTIPPPADERIIETLEKVGLWEHISQYGGFDQDIVSARLSHGQKQLLFVARAILHQETLETKIVLVDEATSSLDHATDAKVQELMSEAFADCTVLTIAHRREYFAHVDVVLELDAGNVVEVVNRSSGTETEAAVESH